MTDTISTEEIVMAREFCFDCIVCCEICGEVIAECEKHADRG